MLYWMACFVGRGGEERSASTRPRRSRRWVGRPLPVRPAAWLLGPCLFFGVSLYFIIALTLPGDV